MTIRAESTGGKRPVGVLREVLMARRVEQIDHMSGVVELHHGRGNGKCPARVPWPSQSEAAWRFDLRALIVPASAIALPNSSSFLGDGRLASVWMGNDGEGTTSRYLARDIGRRCRVGGHAGAGVGTRRG